MRKAHLLLAVSLLVLVGVGYYCAENPDGRLEKPLDKVGYLILWPGYTLEMGLTGNMHARFGDWRDLAIKMGVPFMIYFALGIFLLRVARRKRPQGTPD